MDEVESLTLRLQPLKDRKNEFKRYLLSKAVKISSKNLFVDKIYEAPDRILVDSAQSMREKFSTELELVREVIEIVVKQWAIKELLTALCASKNEHLFEDIKKWIEEQETSLGKPDDSAYIIEELESLKAHKEDFKRFLCGLAGEVTQVDKFVSYLYSCTPPILEDDYKQLSKIYPKERNLAEEVIKIVVTQWAVKQLIEALKQSCNERQFFPEIKQWIRETTQRNSQEIPSQSDSHSQSSEVLPCCGYISDEIANDAAVLCRHIWKSSVPLRADEWENFDRQEAMNSAKDDGFKVRNKDVKLRTLLDVCSMFRELRHVELESVKLNNLEKGKSVQQTIFHRVNFPKLETVYMSFRYENKARAGKTLKKEWINFLLFFVPGKHKWNNLWNVKASPKLAQVFLEVNGIVYIHMKKAAGGNALVLSEWRKLSADDYLQSTQKDLNYFHCLGRTISLDLLSSCKNLKELNLYNCYFPRTGNSVLPDVAQRLCDALCKLPNLSKLTFDAKRFKESCFDLSLISKRKLAENHATLQLVLGHTKIIWSNNSTPDELKSLNSLANCNFSKMIFCKCEINELGCINEEFTTRQFATKPESGILELENKNTTVKLNFYEFQWIDDSSDTKSQIRPHFKSDYYHLFQLYNFYSRKYWESKLDSSGKKTNE